MAIASSPKIDELFEVLIKYESDKRERAITLGEFSRENSLNHDPQLQLELIALDIEIRLQLGDCVEVDNYYLEYPHLGEKLLAVYKEVRRDFLKNFCPFKHHFRALPKNYCGYEVEAEIGRGSMGVVYQARRLSDNKRAALKVSFFRKHVVSDEARTLGQIEHPNIRRIIEIDSESKIPFICMELVDGQPLSQLIVSDGAFEPPKAAKIVAKLAAGLSAIHETGIVHFDISPKNILIRKHSGQPIVTDFGLATAIEGIPSRIIPATPYGTIEYMAPEVLDRDFGVPGTQTDVYALGAVLYTLLTGFPPFRITSSAMLKQICTHPPARPRDFEATEIDAELEAICLGALSKRVGERTECAKELQSQLEDWLSRTESRSDRVKSA